MMMRLSEEERQAMRKKMSERHDRMMKMSQEERQAMHEKMMKMSADERRAMFEEGSGKDSKSQ